MPNGYHGKILHVNLTTGALEVERPAEAFYRRYMGGSALGLHYLVRHTPPGTDPLGPDNTLVLALSVLTGAPISGQSRITAVAKSPLTGAVGDAQAGGFFPAEMKFAGFDAVVLRGRAPRPVYLWLHDGQAELRDAAPLGGRVTGEVEDQIREDLSDRQVQVLQCGPAGEKGVRFAALINMANRANGRTGMGAVMGSKNLKAVAVRGTDRPSLFDRAKVLELARWGAEHIDTSDVESLARLGTAGVVKSQQSSGGLPTRNWTSGAFEGWKPIDGRTLADTILKERDTCYACSVRCKRVVAVDGGTYCVSPRYGGPEYETLAALGSYCGVDDLNAVAYANQLCNMYGLDTISCGATIAWAMDCFERGLLTTADTDGLALSFGNAAAMVDLIEKIARRKGFGDLLAEGSARAAARIGRGTEEFVVAVKKQEFPAHMPQVKPSLALIYAVNPFGADHMSSEHDGGYADYPERMAEIGLTDADKAEGLNEHKVRFTLVTQRLYSSLDSLNLCQFVYGPAWQLYRPAQIVETVRAVAGWDVTIEELLQVGERRVNLMRLFNQREGIGCEADTLPPKMFTPLSGGKSDGRMIDRDEWQRALGTYYQMAGWDAATGAPAPAKLAELGLNGAADGRS